MSIPAFSRAQAISAVYDQNGNTNAVYYVNASGHIQQLYMDTSWHVGWDFTSGLGAPTPAPHSSIAAVYDPIGNTNDLYYVNSSGHIQQLWMYTGWTVGWDATNNLGYMKHGDIFCCDELRRAVSDEDTPLLFVPKFREFGIRILDGGSSYLRLQFCPWSGAKLPESLRDQWFDTIETLGLDPSSDKVPPEFSDERWYTKRPT